MSLASKSGTPLGIRKYGWHCLQPEIAMDVFVELPVGATNAMRCPLSWGISSCTSAQAKSMLENRMTPAPRPNVHQISESSTL